MTLREAVEANHRAAEQTALAKSMIDGTMDLVMYHQLLFNMREIYAAIEKRLPFLPANVLRTKRYDDDLADLSRGAGTPMHSTADYVRYISTIDIPAVWAHVYVHYLGNMYGGQMIGKKLPWKHSHLEFDDLKGCISYVRANITEVDPNEANRAFEWTIGVYDELHRTFRRNSSPS
jgi:heme oxygenase